VLPQSIAIADEYWAGDLGCDRAELRPKTPRVQCHSGGLSDYSGVFVFLLDAAPVVSVPPALLDAIAPRADQFVAAIARDPAALPSLLSPAAVTLVIGPALLNYADRSSFVGIELTDTRELTPRDEPAFDELKAACLPEDWEPKGFSLESPFSFGAFSSDGVLQAIASIRVWAERIAHISVVARPASRKLGFGTRAVAAATERALQQGLLPQYRVLEHNLASRRIAQKLGYHGYGCTLAARLG
jgi:GNAT superfamily N-acetyltransferase